MGQLLLQIPHHLLSEKEVDNTKITWFVKLYMASGTHLKQ